MAMRLFVAKLLSPRLYSFIARTPSQRIYRSLRLLSTGQRKSSAKNACRGQRHAIGEASCENAKRQMPNAKRCELEPVVGLDLFCLDTQLFCPMYCRRTRDENCDRQERISDLRRTRLRLSRKV